MILKALPTGKSLAPVWEVWFDEEESSSLVLACTESQAKSVVQLPFFQESMA